jgi:alpha-tubulin suppressor-like RCC1 family protein
VPDVGDVVVMGITDETPEGFIGRVESTSGTMVTTSPASLQEAVPEADVDGSFDFDEIADLGPEAVRDRFRGVEAACVGGAQITLDVDFGIDARVDLEASWDPFGDGVSAYVGMSATASAGVEVTATGEVECEAIASVDGPKLKPITFFIGPVPVVLVPEISFEAVIGGSFKAEASAGMFYEQTVSAGLRYSDAAGWSTEYSNTRRVGTPEINFAAQATAGVELRARLDLKVYGAAGPYLTVGPFFELSVQNNLPWWTIDAGVRASVGAAIDVFFFKDEVQFAEVDLVRFRLADSGDDPFPGGYQLLEGQPLNAVEAGSTSCGIDGAGYGYCWGDNRWGQAGVDAGIVAKRVEGLDAIGFSPVVEIDSGGTHTCARHSDGRVSCWGSNQFGQLGDGTTISRDTPTIVEGLEDVVEIAVESSQTCARHADLTVSCWGRNGNFQTGRTTSDTRRPGKVPGLDTIVDLGLANEHGCALRATGEVLCWGYNYGGQLGIGETWQPPARSDIASPVPLDVIGLDDVVELDGAGLAMCARKSDGTVWCWGEGNLGGGVFDATLPRQVPGIAGAADLAFDGNTGCVLDEVGLASCWGGDANGSLGNGPPFASSDTPVPVLGGSSFHSISIRSGTVCTTFGFGVGICWGENEWGSIGDGTVIDRANPFNRVQNSATVL